MNICGNFAALADAYRQGEFYLHPFDRNTAEQIEHHVERDLAVDIIMIAERITRFAVFIGLRRARRKQFYEPRNSFEFEITFVERHRRNGYGRKRVKRHFDAKIARLHAYARKI